MGESRVDTVHCNEVFAYFARILYLILVLLSPKHLSVPRQLDIWLLQHLPNFNPIALREAKIVNSFGLSECSRVIYAKYLANYCQDGPDKTIIKQCYDVL